MNYSKQLNDHLFDKHRDEYFSFFFPNNYQNFAYPMLKELNQKFNLARKEINKGVSFRISQRKFHIHRLIIIIGQGN